MNNYRTWFLVLGDFGTLVVSFFITVFIKSGFVFSQGVMRDLMIPFIIIGIICILGLYALDLYDFRFIKPVSANLWRIVVVMVTTPIIGILIFYTFDFFTVAPRLTVLFFFISFTILFILWRRLFYRVFSSSFRNKTIVWSTSPLAEHLFEEIKQNPHRGYEPIIHIHTQEQLSQTLEEIEFSILITDDTLELSDDLVKVIFDKKITLLSLIKTYEQVLQKIPVEIIDETLFIQNIQHRRGVSQFLSRFFDYLVAIPLLVLTSPFLLAVIIAIKLEDGGSIFYKQPRMGFLGKEFMLYKFRSMTEDHKRVSSGADWTTKNDPRVTRVGKIIRRLHIDELPQMINVLKGDITIVGPRPDVMRVELGLKETVPHYHLRHVVKPGFTGWAQIKYHAANDHNSFVDRFQYDLYYIKHREFFFDFGIMLRTLQIIFSHSL